jgi:hypothetical protein
MKRTTERAGTFLSMLCVLAIAFVILPGCSLQQVRADVGLKFANDVKPLVLKDAADIVTISNKFSPPYQPGIICGTGATAWFNALPAAPTTLPGLPNICSASNADPNCTSVDGVGSAAVYIHLQATQVQTAPVTLPAIDSETKANCILMFVDSGVDVNQALAKVGALFGGLALGKGALSTAAAQGFAAGIAAPKP